MTEPREIQKKRGIATAPSLLIFGGISLCLLCLFLYDSRICLSLVNEGLLLCFERLIPALFPFMVLSSMIVSSGILSPLSRLLNTPCHRLFGVGGESGCVWLLGILCGFPVAASSGLTLYRRGIIGIRELRRLMLFANNPSISFLLGAVGLSLLKDPTIGLLLCIVTLFSSLLLGVALRFFAGDATEQKAPLHEEKRRESPSSIPLLFCHAVTSSVTALLSVLGFVVFFYTLTGVLSHAIGLSNGGSVFALSALLLGFFEMTGGISLAAACAPPLSYLLVAFLAGFSGLSVHSQIAAIVSPAGVSLLPCILTKLLQGFLNLLLMGVALWLIG